MTGRTLRVSLGSLALVIALAVACGSDYEGCADKGSCPAPSTGGTSGGDSSSGGEGDASASAGSSAQGGDRSGAGAGGSGVTACTSDEDCDDDLFCTGLEHCVDDFCELGQDPCDNEDPAHCATTCEEGSSGPQCGLEGRDADGDGHLDDACAENPGDDCNDSVTDGAEIHPGADEICNADVDDDCDGQDEQTDEVLLAGSSAVLVAAVGITERDHPSIAAIPEGGFGVVWSDWRAGSVQRVYYRALGADGVAGDELLLTTSPNFYAHDFPDLAPWLGEFVVAYRAQQSGDSQSVIRAIEVKYDGSLSENEVTVNSSIGETARPQVSSGDVYFLGGDSAIILCSTSPSCIPPGPDGPYYADTFHVSPTSLSYVYDYNGDIYFEDPNNSVPTLLTEDTPENRTNPVITEHADQGLIAYRYEDGMRVGTCDLPDGIPIDIAAAGPSKSVLLHWNPEQTALYVRSVSSDCSVSPSALVVEEEGTAIGSAALAVDPLDGTVAVVWSSENIASSGWTIMQRLFTSALCE